MIIRKLLILLFSFILWGCSNEDVIQEPIKFKLTALMPMGGLGDMGYNDLIMSGVMRFYEQHEISMSLLRPNTAADADKIISQWLTDDNGNKPSLLLLAGNEYEAILRKRNVQLNDNQQILIFESSAADLPKGVTTFRMNRYGVSYLAGCMAQTHNSSTIIAAMPDDKVLNEAIDGFTDAFLSYNGQRPTLLFLSNDPSGYNMANDAYHLTSKIKNSFFYPLAGGSNNGVYKCLRENEFCLSLAVGMDIDCSPYVSRIPFSVIYKIDALVQQYLSVWFDGKPMTQGAVYGLDTEWVDIVMNDNFFDDIYAWEEYYEEKQFWPNCYNKYKQEAIEKEKRYETKSL